MPDYIDYLKKHRDPSKRTLERYEDTLRVMGDDMKTVNPLDQPAIYKRLLEISQKRGYAYVNTYLTIFNAWLRINGQPIIHEINYHILRDTINKMRKTSRAYTDDEIEKISFYIQTSNMPIGRRPQLRKLLVLMLYAGLRVGACQNIRYDQFRQVDGHDVFTFPVHSKGIDYNAFISGNAYRFLLSHRYGAESVVNYDVGYSIPFAMLYRMALNNMMLRRNLHEVRANTSIFHSFRKAYSEKLLATGLDPKDYIYAYLMGHVQRTKTATKFYIMADGTKVPLELLDRCATAYEKTTLQTSDLLLRDVKE